MVINSYNCCPSHHVIPSSNIPANLCIIVESKEQKGKTKIGYCLAGQQECTNNSRKKDARECSGCRKSSHIKPDCNGNIYDDKKLKGSKDPKVETASGTVKEFKLVYLY